MEKAGIKRPSRKRLQKNVDHLVSEYLRNASRQHVGRMLNGKTHLSHQKIICILASTAQSSLLGGKSITPNRGKIMKMNG
jgi:hypothetical protein